MVGNLRFNHEGWVEYWDPAGKVYRFPMDRLVEIIVRFGECSAARAGERPPAPVRLDDSDLPADPTATKVSLDEVIDGHYAAQDIETVYEFVERVLKARRLAREARRRD